MDIIKIDERCQDKSWEDRNEQANEDEEKEDWMQKTKFVNLSSKLSKFEGL